MSDHSRFERRIGMLIEAYAERAPVDIDPFSMARSARLGSRHARSAWFGRSDRALLVAGLATALLAAFLIGAVTAGSWIRQRDPIHLLAPGAFVEPFTGLPPDGAMPSLPETGELVVSFAGRVRDLGYEFHRMWVFEDGRILWKRNLEGSGASKRAFGDLAPTTALIEQRLSSEGVERLRAAVWDAGLFAFRPIPDDLDTLDWQNPGVLWGAITLNDGQRIVSASWSEYDLAMELADAWPGLPATAWSDPRLGGFVPTRYAVCVEHFAPPGTAQVERARVIDQLPESTKELLRSRAAVLTGRAAQDPRCHYEVTIEAARAIVATLEAAGLQKAPPDLLRYEFPVDPPSEGGASIELLPIVPSGEAVCNCG